MELKQETVTLPPYSWHDKMISGSVEQIVAVDKRGGIASDGEIPWHLPGDRKHFFRTTVGGVTVVGRRTFEEDFKSKPLPNRPCVVVTRDPHYLKEAYPNLYTWNGNFVDPFPQELRHLPLWICGGADIYDKINAKYNITATITHVYEDYKCDLMFGIDRYIERADLKILLSKHKSPSEMYEGEGDLFEIIKYKMWNPIR